MIKKEAARPSTIAIPRPHKVILEIEGISNLQWTRKLPPKGEGMSHADHEEAVWRDKFWINAAGHVVVPAMALRDSIAEAGAGQKLGNGKGAATFSGQIGRFLTPSDEFLAITRDGKPIKREDLVLIRRDLPSNPSKDDGARVEKNLPTVAPGWKICAEFVSLAEDVNEAALRALTIRAGIGVGIGCWRPGSSSRGLNGRFKLVSIVFERSELGFE